jgi:hypothetical protein
MKNFIAAFAFLVATVAVSAMAFTPPISAVVDGLPALNSAGDHVYASAGVSDGTGTVTTVAAAGTYVTVGTVAPMAAGEADGSGCITYTLASNKFTIAARCGVGHVRLRACLNDVVGANSAVVLGAWHRVRSGTTTVASPIARNTYAASAVRGGLGCIERIVDANLSDTYDFRFDSGTNGDTVTTRAATFTVEKVLNK